MVGINPGSSLWQGFSQQFLTCLLGEDASLLRSIQNSCRKVVSNSTPLCVSEILLCPQFNFLPSTWAKDWWPGPKQARSSSWGPDWWGGATCSTWKRLGLRPAPSWKSILTENPKIIQRFRVHMPNPVHTCTSLPLSAYLSHTHLGKHSSPHVTLHARSCPPLW